MSVVLGITLPLFCLILAGFVAGRRGWFTAEANRGLGLFVFRYAVPVMLFRTLAEAPLDHGVDWSFVAAFAAAGLAVNLGAMALARWCFGCGLGEAALQGMAASFGNIVFIALPIAVQAFGPAAALPIVIVVTIDNAIAIPLATTLVALAASGRSGLAGLPLRIGRAVALNPVVASVFIGIGWQLTGLGLAEPVDRLATLLGAAAVPCALFSLGVTLAFQPITDKLAETSLMVTAKTLLHPAAVFCAMTYVVEVDPLWRAAAVLAAAMPVGANVYLLAQNYGTYIARTSTAVMLSTAVSLVTVSALLVVLTRGGGLD